MKGGRGLVNKVISSTTAQLDGMNRRVADLLLHHKAVGNSGVGDVEAVRVGADGLPYGVEQ